MTRRSWSLWRSIQVIKSPQAPHPIGTIKYQIPICDEAGLVGKFIRLTRTSDMLTLEFQHLVVGELPPEEEELR